MRSLLFNIALAFSLVAYPDTIQGQSLPSVVSMGDSAAARQDFELAGKYYQRAAFFAPSEMKPAIYFRSALANQLDGKYETALFQYDLILNDPGSTTALKTEAIFNQVQIYLLKAESYLALGALQALPEGIDSQSVRRGHFYKGLIYFDMGRMEQAEKEFLLTMDEQAEREKLQELMKRAAKLEQRKMLIFPILSAVLPGTGQVLAGETWKGINSLLLVSGFVALNVHLAVVYGVIDSLLIVLPWTARYYRGGISDAMELARERKAEKKMQLLQELLALYN